MLNARNRNQRRRSGRLAPLRRPTAATTAAGGRSSSSRSVGSATHPLTDVHENSRLYEYEVRVKEAFDGIVSALKKISALQHETDFVNKAQRIAQSQLGFELPTILLEDAWVDQLDMRSVFAWSLFETYRRFSDDVFT